MSAAVLEMKPLEPLDLDQLLSEAGRIARGETMMQGRTAHVQALYAIIVSIADPHTVAPEQWKKIQVLMGKAQVGRG